jgi:outer membrane lipoprotein-sorting protein
MKLRSQIENPNNQNSEMKEKIMKKSLIVAASMFLFAVIFASTPSANAQCNVPPVVKDLAKKLSDKCKSLEGTNSKFADCSKKIDTFKNLVQAWNNLVGNSSLRLSPRDMEWNTAQTGNLVAPGDRRFISQIIEDGKGVTISVKKTGEGKAACEVYICAVDIDTQVETSLGSFTFAQDAKPGEQSKSFSAAQVGKKIVVVRLNGKGLASRFPYEFKASKN